MPKNIMALAKTVNRRVLPTNLYRYGVSLARLLRRPVWAAKLLLTDERPSLIIHFGIAPGDDLLCTAILRESAKRGHNKIWMSTNYPELFSGNPDACKTVTPTLRLHAYATVIGAKWLQPNYAPIDWKEDRSTPPVRHIIAELCLQAGLSGQINVRPYYYPTPAELEAFSWCKDMVAIQSSGLASKLKMANKQWYPDRFQAVVDKLGNDVQFVQVGAADDPALDAVARNMQGKTTIRETAAILSNCRLFVGNVGFLMHLARAVDTRSVIIYGGREAPWQSGYSCNVNLYSAEPCAPCWFWNRCDFNRICMDRITADHVAAAVNEALHFPRVLQDQMIDLDTPVPSACQPNDPSRNNLTAIKSELLSYEQ